VLREEAIIEIPPNKLIKRKGNLHAFIAQYVEESRYDLIEKLGFDNKKFKVSGGKLFPTSLEIDFNYPISYIDHLIIHISILDIDSSHIRIKSKIYNQSYNLLANAISTFVGINIKMHGGDVDLRSYFKSMEVNVKESITH